MIFPVFIAVMIWFCWFLMAIYLSIAVQYDAAQRLRAQKSLFLVGHWGWFFIALFTGGFIGAFAYWIIHYSALRHVTRDEDKNA
jgi:hypothetical protein